MKKRIKIFLIIVMCIMLTNITLATDLTNLQEQKNDLKEQIGEAEDYVDSLDEQVTSLLEEINELDDKIKGYNAEITDLELQLSELQVEIEEAQKNLDTAQKNYDNQKSMLEQRIVAQYEAGETTYLDVLLNSTSISEFISRYYLIAEIMQYDKDLLDGIEAERIRIEEIEKSLQSNKETLETTKTEKERKAVSLENTKTIKNSKVSQLNEEEQATQNKIQEYKQQLEKVENNINTMTATINGDYAGGEMAWPSPGYSSITSPFGMRLHPVLGYYRMHTGVDIGSPRGAPIVAANDGVVKTATYSSGYGYYIIVDHGGGIMTVYAHASQLLVSAGDTVTRGQTIMKAGATGLATGPHLHFEVRVNGNYVNPIPYITS